MRMLLHTALIFLFLEALLIHPTHALEKSFHGHAPLAVPLPGDTIFLSDTATLPISHLQPVLYFDYQLKSLSSTSAGVTLTNMDHFMALDLGIGYGLTQDLSILVDAPVALLPGFARIGAVTPSSFKIGVGDIRALARWRMPWFKEKSAVQLGLEGFVWIPTGSEFLYLNQNAFSGGATFISRFSAGAWRVIFNAGADLRPDVISADITTGPLARLGLAAAVKTSEVLIFDFEVSSATLFSDFFSTLDTTSLQITTGIQVGLGNGLFLKLGLGSVLYGDAGTPPVRFLSGLRWETDPRQWMRKKSPKPEMAPVIESPPAPPPPTTPPTPVPVRLKTIPTERRFLPIQ